MLLVGLTGGVAAGKSSAAIIFRELGVPVVDADAIARQVYSETHSNLSYYGHLKESSLTCCLIAFRLRNLGRCPS